MDKEARLHGTTMAEHPQTLRLWLRMLTCTQLIETEVRAGLRDDFATWRAFHSSVIVRGRTQLARKSVGVPTCKECLVCLVDASPTHFLRCLIHQAMPRAS